MEDNKLTGFSGSRVLFGQRDLIPLHLEGGYVRIGVPDLQGRPEPGSDDARSRRKTLLKQKFNLPHVM